MLISNLHNPKRFSNMNFYKKCMEHSKPESFQKFFDSEYGLPDLIKFPHTLKKPSTLEGYELYNVLFEDIDNRVDRFTREIGWSFLGSENTDFIIVGYRILAKGDVGFATDKDYS